MTGKGETNAEAIKIQGLVDRYLRFRSTGAKVGDGESHLDEDLLTAFVEGRVGERESPSVLKHLIDCSFCLHVTGELARLNFAFAEEDQPARAPLSEPVKASDVLSSLIARIFGSSNGEVFAHHETKEDEPENPDIKDEKNS